MNFFAFKRQKNCLNYKDFDILFILKFLVTLSHFSGKQMLYNLTINENIYYTIVLICEQSCFSGTDSKICKNKTTKFSTDALLNDV